jgi:hypothetical protein
MKTSGLNHLRNLTLSAMGWMSLVLIIPLFSGCLPEKTGPVESSVSSSVVDDVPEAETSQVAQARTEEGEDEPSVEASEAGAIVVREDTPDEAVPAEAQTGNMEASVQNILNDRLSQEIGGKGTILIEEPVYDFGELSPKDVPTGQFKIKNIGEGLLNITNVKVCCGAQHTLDKEALAPGDVATLDLKYHTPGVGRFEKYITVYSDDPTNPGVQLTIKGDVVRKLDWTPARFQLFLDHENGGCQPLTIKSLDGQPFALTSFKSTNDILTFKVDPNQEATEFTVMPTVDLDTLSGLEIGKGMVYIHHTHPGSDRIALMYDLRPRYSFTPHTLLIFNADPSLPRTQRVNVIDNYVDSLSPQAAGDGENVNARGSGKFQIESVTVAKETAKLVKQTEIKDGYQLEFEISPPEPSGNNHFTDRVTIKLSTGNEINIPVNGIYSTKAMSHSTQDQQSLVR